MFKCSSKIEKKIVSKAESLLRDALNSRSNHRLMIRKLRSGKYESISVTRNFRLLHTIKSDSWQLVSHEKYNKLI